MKKLLLAVTIMLLIMGTGYSQVDSIAVFNRALLSQQDTTMPYYNNLDRPGNMGIRSVWVANDLDGDGKQEVLATDYTNNGRVHVLEMNGSALEIVWSSPIITSHTDGSGSTPRWVRDGDLDGDGIREIIFPISQGSTDFEVQVWEADGTDNGYQLAITLPAAAFTTQGAGNFRTNREVADVFDYDGDGSDELIMANRDNRTYILGVSGNIPGFGAWQLEGGDPATVPKVGFGSIWHSVPADINGDGDIEIINHYWNFLGFWSIDPTAADTYAYPDTGTANHYVEFLRNYGVDAVAYMGIQPADVDGDGDDEIAAINYGGASSIDYDLILVDFSSADDELYSWDTTHYAKITDDAFGLTGAEIGEFWGIGAADVDADGDEEILLGGISGGQGISQEVNGYDIIAVDYNGSGSLLDPSNYTTSVLYQGYSTFKQTSLEFRDSLGVIDTVVITKYASNTGKNTARPFVSKMYSGSDINGNGDPEIILSYQSVYDSIAWEYSHWDGSAFAVDSIVTFKNPDQYSIRALETNAVTGIRELNLSLVTPDDYTLDQNYPNPFNPTTSIRFSLPIDKKISLTVYDILGNEVKALLNQELTKGSYEVTWDGTNNAGSSVASGQYIYTLKYGNFSKSMKMTMLK